MGNIPKHEKFEKSCRKGGKTYNNYRFTDIVNLCEALGAFGGLMYSKGKRSKAVRINRKILIKYIDYYRKNSYSVFANGDFPEPGAEARGGWTLKDMARSPEHKTPSGLAGGKKMSMVAGRCSMKLKLNWTQGQKRIDQTHG